MDRARLIETIPCTDVRSLQEIRDHTAHLLDLFDQDRLSLSNLIWAVSEDISSDTNPLTFWVQCMISAFEFRSVESSVHARWMPHECMLMAGVEFQHPQCMLSILIVTKFRKCI